MTARIVALDYGERRLGFAVSDPSGRMALASRVVEVRDASETVAAICEACRDLEAERLVVGLPLNMDGTAGPMAEAVRALCGRLGEALGIPVVTWDERMSTSMVERGLIAADVSRRKRRQLRDKLAAQAILQAYLDRQTFAAELSQAPEGKTCRGSGSA